MIKLRIKKVFNIINCFIRKIKHKIKILKHKRILLKVCSHKIKTITISRILIFDFEFVIFLSLNIKIVIIINML